MKEIKYIHHNISLPSGIDTLLYKLELQKKNADYMPCDGIVCFCGEQGSGKTLSAVQYVYNICSNYPKILVVSNMELKWDLENEVIPYTGAEDMLKIENGEYGVIFLLDEMHIEFNSLESKGMDANVFELVSQQRKARKHIVGTSQVFGRLAKPFREQFKYAICCQNYFGILFRQEVFKAVNIATDEDIRTVLQSKCVKFYFAKKHDFELYDTRQIIKRMSGEFRKAVG